MGGHQLQGPPWWKAALQPWLYRGSRWLCAQQHGRRSSLKSFSRTEIRKRSKRTSMLKQLRLFESCPYAPRTPRASLVDIRAHYRLPRKSFDKEPKRIFALWVTYVDVFRIYSLDSCVSKAWDSPCSNSRKRLPKNGVPLSASALICPQIPLPVHLPRTHQEAAVKRVHHGILLEGMV